MSEDPDVARCRPYGEVQACVGRTYHVWVACQHLCLENLFRLCCAVSVGKTSNRSLVEIKVKPPEEQLEAMDQVYNLHCRRRSGPTGRRR
jgi:hypothetical protein